VGELAAGAGGGFVVRLVIPGELPAMNEIVGAANKSRWSYNDLKKAWTGRIAQEAKLARLRRVERAVVRCSWYVPNRRKDPDNIAGGIKLILDGLVMAGVLPGDGWRHVAGIEHEFAVDKDRPRVEIEIREVEEAAS